MTYTCPMHPEVTSKKPGKCPKCGMDLVEEGSVSAHSESSGIFGEYKPLVVIIGIIFLVTVALAIKDLQVGVFHWERVMSDFMAGFFLTFAGFKLLDLRGFAEGYRTYDLLAKRVPAYGYLYPFIELALGLAYVVGYDPYLTNLTTVIIMTLSGIGVAIKLLKKEKFTCSCLGTVFKLPLTKVTLIEDFGMAAMALVMSCFSY